MHYFLTFLLFLLLDPKVTTAQEHLYLNIKELHKKGEYLYKYGLFKIKVYRVFLYCGNVDCTDSDILTNNGSYALKFVYQRDIKKKHSQKGWEVGLKRNLKNDYKKYVNEINWLKNITTDIKKNDEVILYVNRDKLVYYKNNKVVASIKSAKMTNIIFLPWLGKNPITSTCKDNLLKK